MCPQLCALWEARDNRLQRVWTAAGTGSLAMASRGKLDDPTREIPEDPVARGLLAAANSAGCGLTVALAHDYINVVTIG